MFLNPSRLNTLKTRVERKLEPNFTAFGRLKAEANSALERQPVAPTEWYVPGYYRDPQGHAQSKQGLANDANSAYGLGLMYKLTGEERYAQGSVKFLDAWSGQVQSMSTKDDSMLSFSYHFPAMIFAADLAKDSPEWPEARQEQFRDFVRERALPMNTMQRVNNWGNWGLVLVLASAAYLGNDELFAEGIKRWKSFIEEQIDADGAFHHEVGRNDGVGDYGIWYSHFTLMPQAIAAEIARVHGVDLYEYQSPNGRSLRLAYETLVPWACEPETFPYFKGGESKKLVATDYVSYWEILNAHWPNPQARAMLAKRRPLSGNHSAPHLSFTHGDLLADI